MSQYRRDLAFTLRTRGLGKAEIEDVLLEVSQLEIAGADPAIELGTATEYAKAFPRRHRRGNPIVVIGGLLAVAWIAVSIALVATETVTVERSGPFILLPALAILVVTITTGFLSDRSWATRVAR